MTRRRILHVIPTLDQSGAEKQLSLLARRLPSDRFEVIVVALTRGGFYQRELESAGIETIVVGKRLRWDPLAWWRLRHLIARRRPDLVQTWLFSGNTYGRLAARAAGVKRTVATERCVDSWKGQYQLAIDRWLIRKTAVVVVNSQAVKSFYERAGLPSEKLVVIPNGVPPAPGIGEDDARWRLSQLGIDTSRPIVGFIGRLWPQKRVADLIWASDILRLAGIEHQVVIVGDGPRRPSLERFTRNLDLRERVHFLGHRGDALELLAGFDLLVLPSVFEGMPNVVLEAMQAKKPVIATQIPGLSELVEDERTGLLVEPKKPFLLAKAIHRTIEDPELRRQWGEAGFRRAVERFSVERMVESYARLYDELLSDG